MKNASILLEVLTNVTNFDNYKLLDFNREVSKNNVKNIVESFKKFGSAGARIIVVKTKSITGKSELFVVDGQHTIQASLETGLGVTVCVVELTNDTLLNIVSYVAALNNKRKSWSNNNFLFAFKGIGQDEYSMFDKFIKDEKLTITDLLYIFLGGAGQLENAMYKDGSMKFQNIDEGLRLITCLKEVRDILPNKAFLRRAFYKVIRTTTNYEKFVKDIKKSKITFSENELEFFSQLVEVRNGKILKVA